MKCSQQCYTAQRRRRLGPPRSVVGAHVEDPSGGLLQALPSALSGTWDFKWPSGTKLRIAFQQLPSDVARFDIDVKVARALVLSKLDEWLGGKTDGSSTVAPANLSWEIVSDLSAPALSSSDSPRSAKSDVRFTTFVEYDVLVSFLPLPVLLPATEQHPEEVVSTAVAELGRYAHRIEYGVPTVYLGPPPGITASQWFSSADGVFTVVHELGHVLGMPHEQQNPLLPEWKWRPLPEMLDILRNREGDLPNETLVDLLRAEITEPWPGEVGYSDWRPAPKNHEAGLDSVMARPTYQCLLQGGHAGGFDCRNLKECHFEQQALAQLQSPTAGDLKHLLAMYGTRVP